MKHKLVWGLLVVILITLLGGAVVEAQGPKPGGTRAPRTMGGTAFTYQGQLKSGGTAYSGTCSLQFSLFDAASSGAPIGTTQTVPEVTVTNGLFTTPIDFGVGVFNGDKRFMQIAVKCGSDASYTTLAPLQELTPTPYALYSSGAPWTGLSGIPSPIGFLANPSPCSSGQAATWNGTTWTCAAATSYSAGTGLTLVGTQFSADTTYLQRRVTGTCGAGNAIRVIAGDGTVTCEAIGSLSGWLLTGNGGTNPSTNFIGTTDNVALEFRVNNSRALRLEPNSTSPNVIGGYSGNTVDNGVYGATISGGGTSGTSNRASANYSTISGGISNTVSALYGTVSGGSHNTASNEEATVGGGGYNTANSLYATVAGGIGNTASGSRATVGGGSNNTASGNGAVVGGGGFDGILSGGNKAQGAASTVSGGISNTVSGSYGTVGGGKDNTAGGNLATVGGGNHNTAGGVESTVGGGKDNTAGGIDSTVGGGNNNTVNGTAATVGGGMGNQTTQNGATIGGGVNNTASGFSATVGGGQYNTASASFATVPGGYYGSATHYGEMAYANGSFGNYGDAQTSAYVLYNSTTNGTQTELFLDGALASQRITLANYRALAFDILIIAESSGGSSAGYRIQGVIKNVGGTTAFIGTPTTTVLGEDLAGWDAVVQADSTNDALVVKVTGMTSTNIRWVATVHTSEVGW